jgi:hypothetical protein
MKGSNHAFLLLALLPVPKFIHKDRSIRGVLEFRMIHQCLDFLHSAAQKGSRNWYHDVGSGRFATFSRLLLHTLSACKRYYYLLQLLGRPRISHKQFGDPFRHEPRTPSTTLARLHPSRKRLILGTSSHMPRLPRRENRDQLSILDSSPTHQLSTVSWRHL